MSIADPTEGLWFSFHVENEEFIGFISNESLLAHFEAADKSERQLIQAYTKNQGRIDARARQKFFDGAARPIKLTPLDFA